MIKIDSQHPFIASWNESHDELNPANDGTLKKVKNFVFHIHHIMIAACFNPRSETPYHPEAYLFGPNWTFSKEIITPDQVHITADVLVKENATSTTPTVILFNPLGANNGIHDELKSELAKRKCNVIRFDYRGLGSTRRAEDFVVDGESVYQFVTQELGIDENNVHLFGFSLGAATAAKVKALHPDSKGKYVGDRPFKSIFDLIIENCCIVRLGWLIKKITSFVSAIFLAYPLYLLGWEWDGRQSLKMMGGDVRVIFHPNDVLVPFEASLASECSPDQIISLDPSVTDASTHFAPLSAHQTANGQSALTLIADFLAN